MDEKISLGLDVEQLWCKIQRTTHVRHKLTMAYTLSRNLKKSEAPIEEFVIFCKQFISSLNHYKDAICFLQISYRFLTFSRKKKLQEKMNWQAVVKAVLTAFKLIVDDDLLYNEKSKRDKLLCLILKEVPLPLLKEILEKAKDPQNFMLIARFFSHTPELLKEVSPVIINRLKEDFLVDKSSRTIRVTPFLKDIITEEILKGELLSDAIKLIRRSEANIETLNALLEGLTLDLSELGATLLFENLKDLLSSSGAYASSFAETIRLVTLRSSKPDARKFILQKVLAAVPAQNAEPAKVNLLCSALNVIELLSEEERAQAFASWSNVLGKTLAFLSTEELLERLLDKVTKVTSLKAQSFKLADEDWTTYKKTLSSAAPNKYIFAIICRMLEIFLQAAPEDPNALKPLETMIETVYTAHIQVCFKNSAKMITNFPYFINALYLTSKYAYDKKSEKFANNLSNDLSVILDEGNYLNQSKFFQKATPTELSMLFEIFIYNFSVFCQEDDKFEQKMEVLESTLYEIVNKKRSIKTSVILKGLKETPKKHELATVFLNGISSKLLLQPETVYQSRIRTILCTIIPSLNPAKASPQTLLALLIIVTHPTMNRKSPLTSWFFARLTKDQEQKEALVTALENNYSYFREALLLREGIFSEDTKLALVLKGVMVALLRLAKPEILEEIKFLFNFANYSKSTEVDRFEEQVKESSSEFTLKLETQKDLFTRLGFVEPPKESAESNEAKDVKPKVGTVAPKKGTKATKKPTKEETKKEEPKRKEYLDEHQLAKRKHALLQEKMLTYLNPVCDALKILIRTGDPKAMGVFFEQIFEGFTELFAEPVIRGKLQEVLYQLFIWSPFKEVRRKADVLCAIYFNKIASSSEIYIKRFSDKISDVLDVLSGIDFKSLNASWSGIIYDICQHLLVGVEAINSKVKASALSIILRIGKNIKSEEQGAQILDMMIENLSKISTFEETKGLFTMLLQKAKEDSYDKLFYYLLEYQKGARRLALESLLIVDKLDLISSLDRYIKLLTLKYDESKDVSELAAQVVAKYKMNLTAKDAESFDFFAFVKGHSRECMDSFSSAAAELFEKVPNSSKIIIEKLIDAGTRLTKSRGDLDDETLAFLPHFLKQNVKFLDDDAISSAFKTFVENFCIESDPTLMESTIEAAMEIINAVGPKKGDLLLNVLEKYLDKKFTAQINVTAIIFLGQAAPFLNDKSKVSTICNKILNIANSSSVHLQKSLAKCLPNLIGFFDNPLKIAENLLASLKKEDNPDNMRGSAYLLAGFVKGLGIKYFEKMKIFDFVMEDMDVKKESKHRMLAVLILIEALAENLQKIIEPYLVKILNILMKFFGSQHEEIRHQSLRCSKALMSSLSSYGVKQILPLLLQGVDDKAWRAKVANISILGNMTFCAPKQLSSCLPQIVPKLAGAISDANTHVKDTANLALKEIGSTIKNPEISSISDVLIKALSDPYEHNKAGLEVLLKTQFVHYIDTPALSLIIPIIDYGLRNRDPALKKSASQVVGSISHLIKNPEDLLPYLDILLTSLQSSVCDNLGDVRTIAAKAYGTLAKKLELTYAGKLIESLQQILEDKSATSVERAGAAQAMSEVTYSLGHDYLKKVLPTFMSYTRNPAVHIRESYIGIFAYLPTIMESEFEPYITDLLDNIMDCLAEENETLRNLSLRVVKILIQIFGAKDTETLLEPAEEGLFHESPKKRSSSLTLMDEMLNVLTKSVKNGEMTEEIFNPIYYRIICSIHILKYDDFDPIKSAASQIWKNFVENTPKTLRIVLPQLMDKIIDLFAHSYHCHDIVTSCLEEFSAKYGEGMFSNLITFLTGMKEKCFASDVGKLNSLIVALNVMLNSMTDHFVTQKKDILLEFIRDLLITSQDAVRMHSCQVLKTLLTKCPNSKILESILPQFFTELENTKEDADEYPRYLKFFDEIIRFGIESNVSYIGNFLFSTPLKQHKLDIITNNAETLGPTLYAFSEKDEKMTFLFEQLFDKQHQPSIKSSIMYCINQLSIKLLEEKVSDFLEDCYSLIQSMNYTTNRQKVYDGLKAIRFYFQNTDKPFKNHIPLLMNTVPQYYQVDDPEVLRLCNEIYQAALSSLEDSACFTAIRAFTKSVDDTLTQNRSKGKFEINAFSMENGIEPFLHIMKTSLVYGPVDVCEQALSAYRYICEYTKSESLAPFVTKLVGPLIRVAMYRFENKIKMEVMNRIIAFDELGHSIKVLLPQIQTMAIRCIQDYHDETDYLRPIARLLEWVVRNTSRKEQVYSILFDKHLKEENKDRRFAHTYVLQHLAKLTVKELPKKYAEGFLDDLLDITDLNPNDHSIVCLSKTISYLFDISEPKKKKDILEKIFARVESETSDKLYIKFGHLLKIIRVADANLVKECCKPEALQQVMKSYLKQLQARNAIAWSLTDLTKLIKVDQFRKEIVKEVVGTQPKAAISHHLEDEEVTTTLETLKEAL